MTKYNREFLVPYLYDLCALYLADKKLEREIARRKQLVLKYQTKERVIKPREPSMKNDSIGCLGVSGFIFAGMGVLVLVLCFVLDPSEMGQVPLPFAIFLALFGILLGGSVFWFSFSEARNTKQDNEFALQKYRNEMKLYYESCKQVDNAYEENKLKIPQIRMEISKHEMERKRVQSVIQRVYQANVIPGHYRNMYAVVYLYDYFHTSRANDLDMALNMFVLEQIKDKLDIIIERQQETILNQRMLLANQQRGLEEQRAHYAYMKRKAHQVAASMEEQNQYLAMVESNTAATAYFAAANYLK